MKTMKSLIIFTCIMSFATLSAQFVPDPTIQWQNTIGGSKPDYLTSMALTADGGYIVGGYSESDISGDKTENAIGKEDFWVFKLDGLGNIEWQRTLGTDGMDFLKSVIVCSDGGYLLGGYSYPNTVGNITADYRVIKLNALGVTEWQKVIGGNNEDVLTCLAQTAEGGYILGGYSFSNISGDKTENSIGIENWEDYWVVKISSIGVIEWQNTIGGSKRDQLNSIAQTVDGGYILGGWSRSHISGDKTENLIGTENWEDYWVVKLNALGGIEWQRNIGGNKADVLTSISQSADDGYILGGYSRSNISGNKTEDNHSSSEDYWVVKLNALGSIEWQNTIGGSLSEILNSAKQTTDGGYIIGGHSTSNASGDKTESTLSRDYWVVKLNQLGEIEWENTIKTTGSDIMNVALQTTDGGYILGGYSNSGLQLDKTESNMATDFWIIKLFPDTLGTNNHHSEIQARAYPNPTDDKATIDLDKKYDEINVMLYNVIGQPILEKTYKNTDKIDFEINNHKGIYFVKLNVSNGGFSYFKIIKN